MKVKISVFILLFLISTIIYSQKVVETGNIPSVVYKIPFSSKGNSIELTVKNTAAITAEDVEVSVLSKPEWIKFKSQNEKINEIKSEAEKPVTFNFAVDKAAPVKEKAKLKFKITNKKGESWEKAISITVSPPTEFKLYQNYPNPFNPSTTISYTIPNVETGNLTFARQAIPTVQLKIYDILGREVATLINKAQQSGFYKIEWSAGERFASGMYIYQLIAKYKNGETKIQQKKLMLMK